MKGRLALLQNEVGVDRYHHGRASLTPSLAITIITTTWHQFGLFSYALNPFDFLGLLLVLGGLELYHRQPEPGAAALIAYLSHLLIVELFV